MEQNNKVYPQGIRATNCCVRSGTPPTGARRRRCRREGRILEGLLSEDSRNPTHLPTAQVFDLDAGRELTNQRVPKPMARTNTTIIDFFGTTR